MAIAVLPDDVVLSEELVSPWPRPVLRLVELPAGAGFDDPPPEDRILRYRGAVGFGDARSFPGCTEFETFVELETPGDFEAFVELETWEAPWTSDQLADQLAEAEAEAEPGPESEAELLVARGRVARRASARVRWRRVLLGALVTGLLVLLALPIGALGDKPLPTPTTPLQAGSEYVVRPGDTLWSIAERLDPTGDPRVVVAQLSAETGSDTIVPGERLHLP